MTGTARLALKWVVVVTVALFLLATIGFASIDVPPDAGQRLEYLEFALEVYRALFIGFLVATLGILIPQSFTESKYEFERFRESRLAYSEAKTGIEYLPDRLADLEFAAAVELIERVHVRKHVAETYTELKQHLHGRSPRDWGDGAYARLAGMRDVLREHSHDWSALDRHERLQMLLAAASAPGKPSHG